MTQPPRPPSSYVLPPPTALGFSEKFDHYRDEQVRAIIDVPESAHRFRIIAAATGIGKSLIALSIGMLEQARVLILTSTKHQQDQYCVAPSTKVLRADLRWIEAGNLRTGDELLAFDEHRVGYRRWWRRSEVLSTAVITRPCYRLTFDDGSTIVCSAEHQWLVDGPTTHWHRTDKLRVGGRFASKVLQLLDTWEQEQDFGTGYLAAAFDGEGCLIQSPHSRSGTTGFNVDLNMAQNPNEMLVEVIAQMEIKGFSYRIDNGGSGDQCVKVALSSRRDIIRFLGQIRPRRLLAKLNLDKLGMINPIKRKAVMKREYLGPQTVIALTTSTGTFIAEGLASHNCKDAAHLGLKDIRGASNYDCPALMSGGEYADLRGNRKPTADNGPCRAGLPCSLRTAGCPRFDAIRAASTSDLVVSNYDWWMANGKQTSKENAPEVVGDFDYIFLDELHAAEGHIASSLHIELELGVVRNLLRIEPLTATATVDEWREWAKAARAMLAAQLDELTLDIKRAKDDGSLRREILSELSQLRNLDYQLADMSKMYGLWVVERTGSGGRYMSFDPVWIDRYAEERLFRGIPNVVGMSATVRPAEMKYLGITAGAFDFFEYDSPFPIYRRPIYQWPVVRMHYKMHAEDMERCIEAGDSIIRSMLDRRGIVHTFSYKRQREITGSSIYGRFMIDHAPGSDNVIRAVERFKRQPPPAILVSPSIATGVDFPDDACEYIWIPKTPYPPMESAVMRARVATDPGFPSFYAAKEIMQASGRGNRRMTDTCSTIITDSAFGGLLQNTSLFAKWWLRARKFVPVTGNLTPPPVLPKWRPPK